MKHLLVFLAVVLPLACPGQHQNKLEKAFEVRENDLIPEGIAYDAQADLFYISSINKKKILQVSPSGSVQDFGETATWGNFGYLGMKVDAERRLLWACRYQPASTADSAGWGSLYKIDLNTGKALKKYHLPKTDSITHLFNDLLLVGKELYLTDSEAGALLWLNAATDSLEYLLPPGTFAYPNGITQSPAGQALIVATARGLFSVDPVQKTATPLTTPDYYIIGVDGLYTHNGSLLGLQSIIMPETICKFTLDASGQAITRIAVLASNHPDFYKITTGTIRKGWLYFIANSFVTELNEQGQIKDPAKLKNLLVYRLTLE